MARIDSGSIIRTFKHDDIEYNIRNTEEFENESFGFPKNQKLPTDHYEVKHFNIIGAIASGKSTLADRYYAYRIKQQWGNTVDNFKAYDLYATIEAIKDSSRHVHYVILDDFVSKLDSRRSMSSGSVDMTELYYEIRHELKRHAEMSGGNAGGLVIMAILTQDHRAIDKRLRESAMFNVFKTYDPACDELIPDPEIISLLKQLKDESVRICNYNFRKLAVAIDTMGKYTLFYADRYTLPKIPFETVRGESIYKQHRDHLIKYLITNFDLFELSKDSIKAELFFEIDRIEKNGLRSRITKSDFTELIIRAKRLQELQYNSQSHSEEDEEVGLYKFFVNAKNSNPECIKRYLEFVGTAKASEICRVLTDKTTRSKNSILVELSRNENFVNHQGLYMLKNSIYDINFEKIKKQIKT